jgi:hypothetical protein
MTTTLDCPEARIALGVYVLGAIDADERAAVDAHLDSCQECRAELAELAELPGLLALVPVEEAIALAEGPLPGDGPFLLQAPLLAQMPGPRSPDPAPAQPPASAPSPEPARSLQRAPSLGPAPSLEPAPSPEEAAPPEPPPSLPANVVDLAAARRRRRGLAAVGAVAAAAVVIGAASFGGVKLAASPAPAPASAALLQDPHPPGAPNGNWDTVQGGTKGAVATVAFRPMSWGTELAAKVAGLPVGTPCQMYVVKRDGTRLLVGGWTTDADEGAVWYPASAGTSPTDITSFVITVQGGQPITVTAT